MICQHITIEELAGELFIEIANRNPELNLRTVFVPYSELNRYCEAVTDVLEKQAEPYFTYVQPNFIQYSLRNYKMFFVELRRLNTKNNQLDCGLCGSFECSREHLVDYFDYYIDKEMIEIYQSVAKSLKDIEFSIVDEFPSGDK